MAREVGKTLGILLPQGTEQSWAYKTYMEACEHMAREMTPQERAAAFIKSTFPLHLREDGEPCDGDIEDVIAHDKETRRAALLEAAEVAITYGERARDEDLSGSYTSELIVQALDRLAQEG